MSQIWQNLLKQVQQEPESVETNQQELMNQHKQEQVNRIQNPTDLLNQVLQTGNNTLGGAISPSIFVGMQETNAPQLEVLTELNQDTPEDDDWEDDEPEIEDGVDTPLANNFNLEGLLQVANPTPAKKSNTFDMASLFPATPSTTNIEPKRGRGRPPKADNANKLLNQFPTNIETKEDQDKSTSTIANIPTQTQQSSKEILVAIPKKQIQEIGESLQRIASAFIAISQS